MAFSPLRCSIAIAMLAGATCVAQSPQNPSPMVEHTRAHERVAKSQPAGDRHELPLGTLFIPAALSGESRLPLVIHFHGSDWLPEVAAERWTDSAGGDRGGGCVGSTWLWVRPPMRSPSLKTRNY